MPLIMAAGHNNTIGHRPKLLILSTNSDLVSSPLPVGTPLEHIILVFPVCECFVQSACTSWSLNFRHIVTAHRHEFTASGPVAENDFLGHLAANG
jgi:hypothetical protein